MYSTVSYSQMAKRDLEEFEGDIKRYKAADRRSLTFGIVVLVGAVLVSCMVCSAVVLLWR